MNGQRTYRDRQGRAVEMSLWDDDNGRGHYFVEGTQGTLERERIITP